jgi:two-component system invasion response regulator UvrY
MKILICDDHKIVRDGLRQILQQLEENISIGEAGSGDEALNLLKKENFDIILLDISLPDRSGLKVLESVKTKWPSTNVLMLSMFPEEQYAIHALKLGASGYLTKDTTSKELLIAVKRVSEGGKYVSQSLAESIAFHPNQMSSKKKHEMLSAREFEIMLKIAHGRLLKEIGNDLLISIKSVSTYRSRVMDKMEFSKNAELIRYCLENNLI